MTDLLLDFKIPKEKIVWLLEASVIPDTERPLQMPPQEKKTAKTSNTSPVCKVKKAAGSKGLFSSL